MASLFDGTEHESKYTNSDTFFFDSRKEINRYFNKILWFCVATGPAIAAGKFLGIFSSVTYLTCFVISLAMSILALGHYFLIKRWPSEASSGMLALIFIDIFLAYMHYSQIDIAITWFFVPLLSICYCNIKFYVLISISNYILMILAMVISLPHYYTGEESTSALGFFLNMAMGYTIEMIVMFVTGLTLAKIARAHFEDLLSKHSEHKEQINRLNAQMKILNSMAGIYEYANLLDFDQMTEMSLLDNTYQSQSLNLEAHAHSRMNHLIKRKVVENHFEAFQSFTNLRTLQKRLKGHKIITNEFMSKEKGWFRAQYISIEADESGLPYLIIYTIQNIDADKRREELLIHISMTDELTSLYNRRCLENDVMIYNKKPIEDNLVILSVDLNCLKLANDTKGHAAGDELIKGAADCLLSVIKTSGKVYRTGGDEFTIIVFTDDVQVVKSEIEKNAANWRGKLNDALTMSIGYALHRDHPEADIYELEKIADAMMYEEKNRFYRESGLDRRKRGIEAPGADNVMKS